MLDIKSCQNKVHEIEAYDFKQLNRDLTKNADIVGFKRDYFKDSYSFLNPPPSCKDVNSSMFEEYGLSIYKDKDVFCTMAFVPSNISASDFSFASSVSIKELFIVLAEQMYKDLFLYSSIVVIAVLVLLLLSVRKRFVYALNYILFPLSVTLAILVMIGELNLMHFFALIMLIAIGIDYGIYMSNSHEVSRTAMAIRYSLLSTFAGFGVLIFSSIVALNSIGMVISIGIVCVFTLVRVMK